MTGDDLSQSIEKVNQLTDLLDPKSANTTRRRLSTRHLNSLQTANAFTDFTKRCMIGDNAVDEQCAKVLGLNLDYFESLVFSFHCFFDINYIFIHNE